MDGREARERVDDLLELHLAAPHAEPRRIGRDLRVPVERAREVDADVAGVRIGRHVHDPRVRRQRGHVVPAELVGVRAVHERHERRLREAVARLDPARDLHERAVAREVDADRLGRHERVARLRAREGALVADAGAGAARGEQRDRRGEQRRGQPSPHPGTASGVCGVARAGRAARGRLSVATAPSSSRSSRRPPSTRAWPSAIARPRPVPAAARRRGQREAVAGARDEVAEAVAAVAHRDARVGPTETTIGRPAPWRTALSSEVGEHPLDPPRVGLDLAASRGDPMLAPGARWRATSRTSRTRSNSPGRAASVAALEAHHLEQVLDERAIAPRRARAPSAPAGVSSSSAAAATSPVIGVRSSCATSRDEAPLALGRVVELLQLVAERVRHVVERRAERRRSRRDRRCRSRASKSPRAKRRAQRRRRRRRRGAAVAMPGRRRAGRATAAAMPIWTSIAAQLARAPTRRRRSPADVDAAAVRSGAPAST